MLLIARSEIDIMGYITSIFTLQLLLRLLALCRRFLSWIHRLLVVDTTFHQVRRVQLNEFCQPRHSHPQQEDMLLQMRNMIDIVSKNLLAEAT